MARKRRRLSGLVEIHRAKSALNRAGSEIRFLCRVAHKGHPENIRLCEHLVTKTVDSAAETIKNLL